MGLERIEEGEAVRKPKKPLTDRQRAENCLKYSNVQVAPGQWGSITRAIVRLNRRVRAESKTAERRRQVGQIRVVLDPEDRYDYL